MGTLYYKKKIDGVEYDVSAKYDSKGNVISETSQVALPNYEIGSAHVPVYWDGAALRPGDALPTYQYVDADISSVSLATYITNGYTFKTSDGQTFKVQWNGKMIASIDSCLLGAAFNDNGHKVHGISDLVPISWLDVGTVVDIIRQGRILCAVNKPDDDTSQYGSLAVQSFSDGTQNVLFLWFPDYPDTSGPLFARSVLLDTYPDWEGIADSVYIRYLLD